MTISSDNKKYLLSNRLLLIIFGALWCVNLYLDFVGTERNFSVDLRNRVVGARLMDRDISPYFFKWNPAFPETLRDPSDICNIRNNMITSPPSVLLLMRPISKLPYSQICELWVVIHYLFFLLILIPFYFYYSSAKSRSYLLSAAIILLYSGQWAYTLLAGQIHFLLPAILSIILLLSARRATYTYLTIGVLFSLLVWIRPNSLVIFPFLLFSTDTNRRQLLTGFIGGGICFAALTLLFGHERFWVDFYLSCKEWVKNNLSGFKYEYCDAQYMVEGKKVAYQGKPGAILDTEIASLGVILERVFGWNVDQSKLTMACVPVYLASLFASYKRQFVVFADALMLGMLMYWMFEFTAPLMKASYYFIELFIVIYYLAGKLQSLTKMEKVIILLSFVFLFLVFIPLNMVGAELLLMTVLSLYIARQLGFIKKEAGAF